jgi:hypothetical protein
MIFGGDRDRSASRLVGPLRDDPGILSPRPCRLGAFNPPNPLHGLSVWAVPQVAEVDRPAHAGSEAERRSAIMVAIAELFRYRIA